MYLLTFKIAVVLCMINIHAECFNVNHGVRIIDGEDADIKDFPHYAQVQMRCGGAILSDRWVATVASCVIPGPFSSSIILVGGEKLRNSIVVQYETAVFYTGQTGRGPSSIALLYLTQPLNFTDKIKPVKLPLQPPSPDAKLVLVGRGVDENKLPSLTLKKMDVHRLTTEECLDLIPSDERELIERNIEDLEKSFLCGKREGDKPGFCFGDVGGPLTEGDTLVGLAAFLQSPCCGEHRLNFYLNVANFVPWIKSITGLE